VIAPFVRGDANPVAVHHNQPGAMEGAWKGGTERIIGHDRRGWKCVVEREETGYEGPDCHHATVDSKSVREPGA
jgi:hypothetical protein